jgi:TP901 family phage tail tape measure protein
MESEVKIGLILSAYDHATNILEKVFGKTKKEFAELKKASVDFAAGGALIAAGYGGFKLLQGPTEAFAKMEASGNDLKAAMMGPGGVLDESTYKKISALSMDLSDKYKGSATDYLDMTKVLKQNRIQESDILGGIGEATAKLSDLFDMAPAHIAEFSAHMRNDMGVAVGDMDKVMDLVARVHGSGVGKTGSEAVTEMNEFFSKASLGAANLGVQGLEASKQLGALGALFMSRGLSGATVGTNFRRIFDGLRDADKVGKANAVAGMFGKHLNLFKDGQFLGMDNFVKELGKLQDLSTSKIAAILKAFGGKQGLSTDFMEYLTKHGLSGYKEFLSQMDNQADLSDKLSVKMGGLAYQQEVFRTSTENLKASIGETFAPFLTSIFESLNVLVSRLRVFVQYHPHLVRIAVAFIGIASGLAMLWGGVKVVTALTTVLEIFGATLYGIPVIGWIALVISALVMLYEYWDDITKFFTERTIKWGAVVQNVANFIYNEIVFLGTKLLKFVGWLIDGIGELFGQNFGIADKVDKIGSSLMVGYGDMTKLKPAAAARVGLYDAKSKQREGASDAVSGLVGAKDNSTVNNNVTVNVSGGATSADGKAISDSIQSTFDKLMKDHEQRKLRRAF